MLLKFQVENYKNFNTPITIDFTQVGGYQFNTDCIAEDTIGKMLIYGRNSSGKTNLGIALMDIRDNLRQTLSASQSNAYRLNANNTDEFSTFIYKFRFQNHSLIYKYRKNNIGKLITEQLWFEDTLCFDIDYISETFSFDNLALVNADVVNTSVFQNYVEENNNKEDGESVEQVCFVRWIQNNAPLNAECVLTQFIRYINNMHFISATDEKMPSKTYMAKFVEVLQKDDNLLKFEDFLNEMGVPCKLKISQLPDDSYELYFEKNKLLPFGRTASSGTMSLLIMFAWFGWRARSGLFYIDEFDAFFHYELAVKMVDFIKKNYPDVQIILTTHNTNLMNNRLMRPDCLSILSQEGQLTPLSQATKRELREGHNLEKLYIAGEFDAYE